MQSTLLIPTKNKNNKYRKTISLSEGSCPNASSPREHVLCNLAEPYQGVHFQPRSTLLTKDQISLKGGKRYTLSSAFWRGHTFSQCNNKNRAGSFVKLPHKIVTLPYIVLKISKVDATVCIRFREKYSAAMYLGKGKNKEFTKRWDGIVKWSEVHTVFIYFN